MNPHACPHCGSEHLTFKTRAAQWECDDCERRFDAEKPAAPRRKSRVFLSYGHDEACDELVRRLESDLKAHGYDPWVDTREIKFDDDWRAEITQGLIDSGHVLAFLSRHSTRKPGVCRQEVAIALGPGKCHVYTVLVEALNQVTPPLLISRRQWLDMHDWRALREADPQAYETQYRNGLAEILRVLARNEPFAGEVRDLERWLVPMDCTSDMVAAEDGFIGRTWLLDGLVDGRLQAQAGEEDDLETEALPPGEIERWRTDGTPRKVFWLAAEPGWGKSAVAARLAHAARARVMAVHFCKHDEPSRRDARLVVRSIAFQMATQLGEYRALLMAEMGKGTALDALNARELFQLLLANPLAAFAIEGDRGPHDRHLIVLDAIDETLDADGRSDLLTLVAGEFGKLPAWLGLVVTSRPEAPVKRQLGQFGVHALTADDPRNRQDIRAYAAQWLQTLDLDEAQRTRALAAVQMAGEGNFLYLRQLERAVREGIVSAAQLITPDALPKGLASLYERWFLHRFPDPVRYETHQRPLLELMLAAREPLPLTLAGHLLAWGAYGRGKATDRLGSLCVVSQDEGEAGDGDVIIFFHKSLRDWLSDPDAAGELWHASPDEGHRKLAAGLWQAYLAWRDAGAGLMQAVGFDTLGISGRAYALRHLPAHLQRASRANDREVVLTDFAWAMHRCGQGALESLLADYREQGRAPRAPPMPVAADPLDAWVDCIGGAAHLLRRGVPEWPTFKILLQVATEHADDSAITRAAQAWLDRGYGEWAWLRRRDRPARFTSSACLAVLQACQSSGKGASTQFVQFKALALSPDGHFLFAGARDATVRIFDLDTAREVAQRGGHRGEVRAIAVACDGRRFASCGTDGTVRIGTRDAPDAQALRDDHAGHLQGVAFSGDGRQLACVGNDGTLRLWDIPSSQLVHKVDCGQGALHAMAWSADGSSIATVGDFGDIRLWRATDLSCLQIVAHLHPPDTASRRRRLVSVALSRDARVVVAGGADGSLHVVDSRDGEQRLRLLGHQGAIYSVAIASDGRRAASGGADKTVRLWDLDTGHLDQCFRGHEQLITAVALDATGARVFSAATDGTIRVWDTHSGSPVQSLAGSTSEVTALCEIRGTGIAAGHQDGALRTLKLADRSTLSVPPAHDQQTWAIASLQAQDKIVSVGWDGQMQVWHSDTGHLALEHRRPPAKAYGVMLAPDRQRLYVWGEPRANAVFDPLTLALRHEMPALHAGIVRAVVISPDSRTLYSGGLDGRLIARDADTLRATPVAFEGHARPIYALSISPDGTRIASGGSDQVIRVWSTQTGECLHHLAGHGGAVTYLQFAADGNRLVSASWDRTVRIWSTDESTCIAVCQVPALSKAVLLADGCSMAVGTTLGEIGLLDIYNLSCLSAANAFAAAQPVEVAKESGRRASGDVSHQFGNAKAPGDAQAGVGQGNPLE